MLLQGDVLLYHPCMILCMIVEYWIAFSLAWHFHYDPNRGTIPRPVDFTGTLVV